MPLDFQPLQSGKLDFQPLSGGGLDFQPIGGEPSLKDIAVSQFKRGYELTAPIRRIPGDIAKAAGDAVLAAVNLPHYLGLRPDKVTRETFMPAGGVEGIVGDVVPQLPQEIQHFIGRGAHEVITPENVPLMLAGGGLPAQAGKAIAGAFGAQLVPQAVQEAQRGDVEGALLHGALGATGLGAGLIPARAEPRLGAPDSLTDVRLSDEEIANLRPLHNITASDIDEMQGRIPPERQLVGPRGEFVGNVAGGVGRKGEAVPDVQLGQATAATKDIIARGAMKRALGEKPVAKTVPPSDLRPAIQVGDKILSGEQGDTHADVLERNGVDPESIPHPDPRRGFVDVNNPNTLINRRQAEQLSGLKGTAEAGGLDSMDLPNAAQQKVMRMAGEKGGVEESAIPELRTDSLSQTPPSEDIQKVEEKVRSGAEAEGEVREGQEGLKFYTGIPLPSGKQVRDAASLVKETWDNFRATRWNKEQMARLLDAAYNQAKTPEQLTDLKKTWTNKLGDLKMPDGKPLVLQRARGKTLPQGFENRDFLGVRIAVNKDVAHVFDSLTSESGVRRNPVGKAALELEHTIKHRGLLIFDTYHAFRIARKTAFLTGNIPRYIYKALVEYDPAEMLDAYKKGDVDASDVEFYRKNYKDGQLLLKGGLNVKQWAENIATESRTALGKVFDFLDQDVKVGGFDINPISRAKQFNNWVFNKLSRSALMQVGLYELNRTRKAHPEWTEQQQVAHAVRQSNIYLGNLGRQGVLKSQTMRDLSQIAFLAPQWVESLAQSEIRGAKQIGQVPLGVARGKGFNVGTQAKGIGTGIVAYLVANQIINMATTGHPTWENKEKSRKFDAYIPPIANKSEGFWLSPFADTAEVTSDYMRYMGKGEGVIGATAKIAQNKLSPLVRAEETARTGRDYSGRRLNEDERVTESLRALLPTPLPLAGLKSDVPGSEQRQLFASAGLKLEPKGRYEDLQGLTFEQRLKKVNEYKAQRGQMDPSSKVRVVEEAVFRQQERAKDVTKQLERKDRNWLESRGLFVPGFSSGIRAGKTEVPMTEDEVRELTTNVAAQTKDVINKLRNSESFNRQSTAAQQEIFNAYMRGMIAVERNRIREQMGKEPEKRGAQKTGTTGGLDFQPFKILQPTQ